MTDAFSDHAGPTISGTPTRNGAIGSNSAKPAPAIVTQEGRPEGLSGASPVLLLVEDNPADVFLVSEALEHHRVPVQLLIASDGEAACRYFQCLAEDDRIPTPELVLLDLNLPRRPGWEVLAGIRSGARCNDVPVVILTSSNSAQDRGETSRLGADFYFQKPTSYYEFLEIGAIVNRVLQERQAETES